MDIEDYHHRGTRQLMYMELNFEQEMIKEASGFHHFQKMLESMRMLHDLNH
jgi:hypothetical protein